MLNDAVTKSAAAIQRVATCTRFIVANKEEKTKKKSENAKKADNEDGPRRRVIADRSY